MTSLRKALLFGFFIWLIPFVIAFLIFPLRESSRPLFESIMPVAVTAAVVWVGVLYFKGVKQDFVKEGLMIGLLWLAISLIIDLPLMLSGGPMQMTLAEYVADIGVTYLLIPVVTVGLGMSIRPEASA